MSTLSNIFTASRRWWFPAPVEDELKDFVEFRDAGFAGDPQAPPDQRTHATEHGPKLIDLR
jgi:hypothetical protein